MKTFLEGFRKIEIPYFRFERNKKRDILSNISSEAAQYYLPT